VTSFSPGAGFTDVSASVFGVIQNSTSGWFRVYATLPGTAARLMLPAAPLRLAVLELYVINRLAPEFGQLSPPAPLTPPGPPLAPYPPPPAPPAPPTTVAYTIARGPGMHAWLPAPQLLSGYSAQPDASSGRNGGANDQYTLVLGDSNPSAPSPLIVESSASVSQALPGGVLAYALSASMETGVPLTLPLLVTFRASPPWGAQRVGVAVAWQLNLDTFQVGGLCPLRPPMGAPPPNPRPYANKIKNPKGRGFGGRAPIRGRRGRSPPR
jgi:hypothetical protein